MGFIEDFRRLQEKMPRIALVASNSENSDYTNYAYKNKNCYLAFGSHYNEDCYYLQYSYANRDSADCDRLDKSELCYECVFCSNLYNCNYLFNCFSCSDSEFGFDLSNCRNTFLCAGLRNVEYHIENEPVKKDEYAKKIRELKANLSTTELIEKLAKRRAAIPQVATIQKNCENCTGSFLEQCKNSTDCFQGTGLEDCMYLRSMQHYAKDCVDCDSIGYDPSELLYESIGIYGGVNNNFCNACWHSADIEYCEQVFNSHDCFGCISRSHAEYEILNQKYSKEDYFKKVREIKEELKREGQYGKWLLPSAYPYEDTIAPLYFGL